MNDAIKNNVPANSDKRVLNYYERKEILEIIKTLNKPLQIELFKIIKSSNEMYSENSNGIFFDLRSMSDETMLKINNLVKGLK